jgi:NADPH2:quinone reductase
MVTFGNASGPVDAMAPLELAKRGSLFLTRPRVMDYYSVQADADEGIAALFDVVGSGKVKPHIGARYALADAGDAHRDLEARKTVGSTVLEV